MKNILICTIARNVGNKIPRYEAQLKDLIKEFGNEYNFKISIYENDSTDNTKELLKNIDYSIFQDYSLQIEDIRTNYIGSVVSEERVMNLAKARNKAIFAKNSELLLWSDYILFVESDIAFNPKDYRPILDFKSYGLDDIDILSGVSVADGNRVYDTWATRQNSSQTWGSIYNDPSKPIMPYYSTFNCVCLYKAEPFKQGVEFHWFNKTINNFDCDTVVICDEFRRKGYDKIFINERVYCFQE